MCLIFCVKILSRMRVIGVPFCPELVQRVQLRVLGCDMGKPVVAVRVWGSLVVVFENWCWTTSGQLFRGSGQNLDKFLGFWTTFGQLFTGLDKSTI